MKKQYIRMNDNDSHLSLGNLFRIIKELTKNKRSAMQCELFCTLFEIENINDTTVNNYCVGIRTIGDEYKQIFLNKQKKYAKDKNEFIDVILNLINIIDGNVHITDNKLDLINTSDSSIKLAKLLLNLAKNDNRVKIEFVNKLNELIKNNDYYTCLVEELIYIVLYNEQPLYESALKTEIIVNILNDTSISSNDLKEYLSLKLREGINYDFNMKNLSNSGNTYACYELGLDEYNGVVYGIPRYDKAYEYFKVGANQNHSGCNYMIGYMFIKGNIGSKSDDDLECGYKYLMKSYEAGNVAAGNTIGNMYYDGIYPLEKNIDMALKYYTEAANNNYVYAINNLGKIASLKGDEEKAYEYYLRSADLGESWACNKMGEFYRNNKDYKKAFDYYNKGIDCNLRNLKSYNFYNLAKYYYENGCSDVVLVPDHNIARDYYKKSSELIESLVSLLLMDIKDYINNKDVKLYEEIIDTKLKIENHKYFNEEIKKEIEDNIKLIKNNSIDLEI